jgi:hypothetical protein
MPVFKSLASDLAKTQQPTTASKSSPYREKCKLYPENKNTKHSTRCFICKAFVCKEHMWNLKTMNSDW